MMSAMKGEVFALSFRSYIFIMAIILVLYSYLKSGPRGSRLQEHVGNFLRSALRRSHRWEWNGPVLGSSLARTWLGPRQLTRALSQFPDSAASAQLPPPAALPLAEGMRPLSPEWHTTASPTVSYRNRYGNGDWKLLQKIRSYSFSIINP